ncbi:aldehyde dehydrogenase family protein [Microbaculum marinisediminis]|uniref:Aldehyde dehydrogenase family protein n=1 Tax=Microbaculum marinisediminis TaxID=2931392 RepID=A0AAW5QYF9_9HYPH|nr:aldehyde dehydrogenase family protein [Microbaculum sp. A6E488]MCT8972040.1 aldehyde dehydrogenase family protein [Microbaculum sp. A6E488]
MTDTVRCISPVNGELYAERPLTPDTEVDAAIAAARSAQAEWKRRPVFERARICSAAVDAMLAMRDEIVPELAWQMGRPVKFGAGELRGFEERARYMIDIADVALARIDPTPKENFRRWISREPLGLVFVVAPWNFPYLTAVNSIIPALMAGNAVILKHAAQTLLVGDRFQKAFDAAGLPSGLFRNLTLSHGQTARIIAGRHVDQVNFTGSVAGGKAMEEAASGTFTGLGLELGGKDPAYVRADCDMTQSIENLVDGAFFNSGQSCCGIERIYVHRDVYSEFVDGFVDLARQYVLGDPLDEATTLGPMVKGDAADFVRGQVDAAVRSGARAHLDPTDFPRDARGSPYMAPQVLTDVNHQMAVMVEESFGPVVGIMSVADDDEAVQLMNDSPYGLTASVWTRDLSAAEQVGERVETGTVFMNRCDYLDPALAWTGVKDTGRGATLSKVGYETLTRPKSWHMRTSFA